MSQFENIINIRKKEVEEKKRGVQKAMKRYPGLPFEIAWNFMPSLRLKSLKETVKYDEDRKNGNERHFFKEGSKKITEILRFLEKESAEIQFTNMDGGKKLVIIFRYRKKNGKIEKTEVSDKDKNLMISDLIFNSVLDCLLPYPYKGDFISEEAEEALEKALKEAKEALKKTSLKEAEDALKNAKEVSKEAEDAFKEGKKIYEKEKSRIFYNEKNMIKKECPELFMKWIEKMESLRNIWHFQSGKKGITVTEEICKEIKSAYEWAKKNPEICKDGPLQFVNYIYELDLKSDHYFRMKPKVEK